MAGKNRRNVVEMVDGDLQFVIHEDEIHATPKDGIVIKVMHAGICHSDVHMSVKDFADIAFPRVFGHEISGNVHEIGDDVAKAGTDFSKGDRVIVYPWGNCNNCNTCRKDQPFCLNQVLPQVDKSKAYNYGVRRDGGFQNYVLVHDASFVIKVPDGIPMDVAALVPCSGITAYNACQGLKESVDRAIQMNGSATVGLFGAGGLALWAIQILKAMYPENLTLIAVDVVDDKLEDAKTQGADKTHKWAIKATVPEVVGGFMASIGSFLDGAIDFTGIEDVHNRIFSLLAGGATMEFVGIGKGDIPAFKLMGLILRGNVLKGIYVGRREMCHKMFGLIRDGKVKPPPITAVKLDDVADSIDKMRKNQIRGRHIVRM